MSITPPLVCRCGHDFEDHTANADTGDMECVYCPCNNYKGAD